MEKLLPQNIEAEIGVLGGLLIDPDAISQVADTLRPDDFYRESHRLVYEAMLHLYQRHTPADFITLCDELARRGTLEDIGGMAFVDSLTDAVPTSAHVTYYKSIITQAAQHRRLIHAAGLIAANAYEESDDALLKAEELIFKIGKRAAATDFTNGSTIMSAYLEKLDYLYQHRGSIIGVPTGYRSLDRVLGGLQHSDLIILAARPGMGKTSAALNIGYNAIMHHQKRIALFSLEMSKEQIMGRLVSMDTGIDSQNLRTGKFQMDDWDKIVETSDRLSTDMLWIDDTAGLSIMDMRSRARRLHAERPVDLIIIDYLQLMQAYSNGKRYENRVQEISEISSGLKGLAKELNVPVLALSQLSRAVEQRADKIPQLSDLRESGTLEQDSDVVLFLYRDDYYAGCDPETGESLSKRPGTADIIIAKHRNGPTGEVTLRFLDKQTRFLNPDEGITSY